MGTQELGVKGCEEAAGLFHSMSENSLYTSPCGYRVGPGTLCALEGHTDVNTEKGGLYLMGFPHTPHPYLAPNCLRIPVLFCKARQN